MRTRLVMTGVVIVTSVALFGCTANDNGSAATDTATGAATSAGISPDTAGTAIASSILTTPQAVQGSDGAWHLAYELVLTNATSASLRVNRIEVLDATDDRAILTISGERLRADFTPLGGQAGDEQLADPASTGSSTMGPSSVWVAWLDVSVAARSDVPAILEHRVTGSALLPSQAQAPAQAPMPFVYTVSRIRTSTARATVLSAPVRAGDWFMSEGCCSDDTHHRRGIAPINGELQVPERFGIDFFSVDSAHRTWAGDPEKLSSYFSYRQPVIAAAPGTVVASRNDLPNNSRVPKPAKKPPIDEAVGNFVIEKLDSGQYVLYGHLDPGSITVHVGQNVDRGRELGLIGSSGNSTTPHLHFQTLTEPTFFPSDSEPYVFDSFTLLGRVPERIWDDDLGVRKSGRLPFEPASPGGRRTDELPLDRTVVRFG